MRYVLMNRDRAVVDFDVDILSGTVSDVRLLEGAAWAPLGILVAGNDPAPRLTRFVTRRTISFARPDISDILEATGAHNAVELAFRAGGFSLSDQFWYRAEGSSRSWREGNFFDNDWDPAFGQAVLARDYRALAHASILTPDVTCSGSSRKAWVPGETGPRLLKTAADAGTLAEVLTSRMLSRLLGHDEFVPYELVEVAGVTLTSSPAMAGAEEEVALAWQVLSAANLHDLDEIDDLLGSPLVEDFRAALAALGVETGEQVFAKRRLIDLLTLNRDVHSGNFGVIRNCASGEIRLAPFFDHDHCFGLAHRDNMVWAVEHAQLTMLMLAHTFSDIDATLDYSWYDPHALDGFEDEFEPLLSSCEDVPPGYARLLARLFTLQRDYVNRTLETLSR